MPETATLFAKVLSLILIILATWFGVTANCFPEALIFCGLAMVCRNLNAVQMGIFAIRQAIGDKRALPIEIRPSGFDKNQRPDVTPESPHVGGSSPNRIVHFLGTPNQSFQSA